MSKFRATDTRVTEHDIIRETQHSVSFIKNGRETTERKRNGWASWHDSKDEAVEYLVQKAQDEITSHERNIQFAKDRIAEIYKNAKV